MIFPVKSSKLLKELMASTLTDSFRSWKEKNIFQFIPKGKKNIIPRSDKNITRKDNYRSSPHGHRTSKQNPISSVTHRKGNLSASQPDKWVSGIQEYSNI